MSKPQPKTSKSSKSSSRPQPKKSFKLLAVILVILALAAGAGTFFFFQNQFTAEETTSGGHNTKLPDPIYSILTGEEISNLALNFSPTFCIQIPNGSTDGARPQVGLREAGVVFEAIAETGITRFAAVFQNPTSSVIGPIRSLRPYYLDWDTPFDCTVVHAGGSSEALAAIATGGQRNLDENPTYMWRESNSGRLWNNLFTSSSLLLSFNNAHNYTTSKPKTFPRLTPDAAATIAADNRACAVDEESICENPYIPYITIAFSGFNSYNTSYAYDPATNTYLRSYATGDQHLVYECPSDANLTNISADCSLAQVAPSAVVAMRVQEHTMSDNYHESISTIGSGDAYIFQNGTIIEATWKKSSQNSQIVFSDTDGNVVSFAPGQLWIAAVPQFGNVSWQENNN